MARPLVARAQQAQQMRRIGVLMAHPETDPEFPEIAEAQTLLSALT